MGHVARAAVLRARTEPFSIEQVELPDLASDQVLVEIAGVGICHTDLLPREGLLPGEWPVILGHEGSGVVTDVGPGVSSIERGDHVVLSFDSCGCCLNCVQGHPAYCDTFFHRNLTAQDANGTTALDGANNPIAMRWFGQSSFASHAIATARNVVVVDRDLPLEMLGPFGCGFLTGAGTVMNVLDVKPGESIVVAGLGGVGMAGIMAAVHLGATRIVALDIIPARVDIAKGLGATHALASTSSEQLTDAILDTGGPVTHVFDTTGAADVISACVDAMAPRGVCATVGVQRHDLVLGPRALSGGKSVTAVYEGDTVPTVHVTRLIELWRSGRFPIEKLITTYPLASVEEALHGMAQGDVIKAVLVP